MSVTPTTYRRLPGRAARFAGCCTLYQGADHLLHVSSTGYSERYKRFYFRDIRALIVLRTSMWLVWIAALGFPGLLLLAIGFGIGDVGGTVLEIIGGVLLLVSGLHALRGPSCACYVQTAVQTSRLPSLSHVRRTEKILALLKPLIDEAQGSFPAAEPASVVAPPPQAEPEPPGDDRFMPPRENATPPS